MIDHYGERLLDMCQTTGLLIANGRLYNDQNHGKLTFCSHTGQSTVDYLLLNLSDFDTISYFDILESNEYSDHAPISFHFHLKYCYTEINAKDRTENNINKKKYGIRIRLPHLDLNS